MKFTAKAKNLLKEVAKIEKIASQGSPIPAQKNIFLETTGDVLVLRAFNNEADIRLHYTQDAFQTEPGTTSVNAKLLGDLLRKIGDQIVTVVAGAVSVQLTWPGGRSTIPAYDFADWPGERQTGDARVFCIGPAELRKAIGSVADACIKGGSRPVLSGVLFEFGPAGSALVASNSRLLNIYELQQVSDAVKSGESVYGAVVPQDAVKVAEAIIDDGSNAPVSVAVADSAVRFMQGESVLTVSTLNGKYPHWRGLIPDTKPENIISIDREVFLEIVRRVRVCADAQTQVIRLDVKPGATLTEGQITVSGEDLGNAVSAEESCACQYKGEDQHIAFRGEDLEMTLESLPCKSVSLYIAGERKAAYVLPVEPERLDCGAQNIIMPVMSTRSDS